jgi:DNA-binding response OmpR family regulator
MGKTARQHRILVVDDNQDAAELLQMLLEIEGYEVRVAFDGASGFTGAANFHPHVICSDLNMPGLSGFELALALRRSDHSCGTHLIAMTGLDTQENFSKIMAAGFDVHFCKPFNLEEFIDYLRSFLAKIDSH